MLTLQSLFDAMTHAIGGQPDPRVSLTQVANDALSYLFNLQAWSWRERPPLELTSVIDQNFLPLPSDFGELLSISRPNREVELTSLQDVMHRRSRTLIPPPLLSVYVAISFPAQADQTAEAPVPQLEFYPIPTSADSYFLNYRAGPIALVNTTDVPNIPPTYERLLLLLSRAFIRDMEEQASTTEWDRAKEEVEKLKEHDAASQQNLGESRGGATTDKKFRMNFFFPTVTAR